MRIFVILCALLFPLFASAGVYEDMEEAFLRNNASDAIALLKRGMDVNTVDSSGNTLLFQAVRADMPELVDYLLKNRAHLNTRNKNGESALSIAANFGRLEYVKRLVESGAEVNFFGWSPLAYATFNARLEITDYLLKHGAEVNATTENGSTALFFAARSGNQDIVELLLKNKADPSIANERGETAVDWALKAKNTDIEAILRKAGGRSGKAMTLDLAE